MFKDGTFQTTITVNGKTTNLGNGNYSEARYLRGIIVKNPKFAWPTQAVGNGGMNVNLTGYSPPSGPTITQGVWVDFAKWTAAPPCCKSPAGSEGHSSSSRDYAPGGPAFLLSAPARPVSIGELPTEWSCRNGSLSRLRDSS